MNWIYFSPHLDDVALSCGGLLWEQAAQGLAVSIWTVCSGDPPAGVLSPFAASLHTRWQLGLEAVAGRRLEDADSCRQLNASYRHLTVLDCIYRQGGGINNWLYTSEEALVGELHEDDSRLATALSAQLAATLPAPAVLVCPLALGGHVDHQLTRAAVERVVNRGKWSLWYYADYPYVDRKSSHLAEISPETWTFTSFTISQPGLEAWGRAVAAHSSQISTFWPDAKAMWEDLQAYSRRSGGVRLWQPIKNEQAF